MSLRQFSNKSMPSKKKSTKKPSLLRRVGTAVKGRYFKGSGFSRPKVGQILRDVSMLKTMVNAEKKRYDIAIGGTPIGQLNGAVNSGMYVTDITPIPAQGTSSVTRNGNSIRVHSGYFRFQMWHQSATVAPVRGEILFVRVNGQSTASPNTFATQMFNLNPFVLNAGSPAIVDLNSDFNPDYFRTFKVLKRKRFYVPMDTYSGVTVIKTFAVPFKFRKHHVRFSADGSTGIATGQILMIIRCDNGNISTTTASTLNNVPVAAANTGLFFSSNLYYYFYDN